MLTARLNTACMPLFTILAQLAAVTTPPILTIWGGISGLTVTTRRKTIKRCVRFYNYTDCFIPTEFTAFLGRTKKQSRPRQHTFFFIVKNRVEVRDKSFCYRSLLIFTVIPAVHPTPPATPSSLVQPHPAPFPLSASHPQCS